MMSSLLDLYFLSFHSKVLLRVVDVETSSNLRRPQPSVTEMCDSGLAEASTYSNSLVIGAVAPFLAVVREYITRIF